ncbi:NucA/NucB deoxyribonuclease domain-containing protein [Nocardioides sp. cx-173]
MSNENVDESAEFIKRVQETVAPWGVAEPYWLTRTTPEYRDLNRKAACRGFDRQGKSCDEFPFASTLQGCFTWASESSCNAASVDLQDNVRAGRKLGAFYRRERIMRSRSDDQFYVKIYP